MRLAQVKRIAFDKTGTLTEGRLEVAGCVSTKAELTDDALFELLAAVEHLSEHPIGKAVAASRAKAGHDLPEAAQAFQMQGGCGVKGVVNGTDFKAGRAKRLKAEGMTGVESLEERAKAWEEKGGHGDLRAVNGEAAGFAALTDTERAGIRDMVTELKAGSVPPVLLTGDQPQAAHRVASVAGIDEVKAQCLPETKLAYVGNSTVKTAMIGGGVNDAPALKRACVGIAMGGVGSGIAVNASDIVLVHDDIRAVPYIVRLSKRMMNTIRLNSTFSLTLNFIAIALAATGMMDPMAGALVHNAGSVAVIINSARLLKGRHQKGGMAD